MIMPFGLAGNDAGAGVLRGGMGEEVHTGRLVMLGLWAAAGDCSADDACPGPQLRRWFGDG